jgi:DNA-binding transcriptional LysR family regulator
MRASATRGEPPEAHGKACTTVNTPDWESVRLFIEVVRRGSIRSAADRMTVSFSALRRRIAGLEQQLNTPLITRHVDGVRLTPEGQKIFAAGCRMEAAAFGLMRAKDATASDISGEVKIAVTEGTGTFWLVPRLVELQRTYPKLLVDLKCLMSPVDVSSLEADVAIQLIRPDAADLKVVRLGFLHTMPFAAPSYIKTYGLPTTFEELKKQRFVLHVADQTQAKALFAQYVPDLPLVGTVAVQTNVASAHLWAVAKGAGIGWLPTYTHFIGGRIVPIDVEPRFRFEIWLTYHPDAAKIARVRRVIDWVKDSFDARKFPWFGEQFIHPYDLPKAYRGEPLINMFEGFAHAGSRPDQTFGRSKRSAHR